MENLSQISQYSIENKNAVDLDKIYTNFKEKDCFKDEIQERYANIIYFLYNNSEFNSKKLSLLDVVKYLDRIILKDLSFKYYIETSTDKSKINFITDYKIADNKDKFDFKTYFEENGVNYKDISKYLLTEIEKINFSYNNTQVFNNLEIRKKTIERKKQKKKLTNLEKLDYKVITLIFDQSEKEKESIDEELNVYTYIDKWINNINVYKTKQVIIKLESFLNSLILQNEIGYKQKDISDKRIEFIKEYKKLNKKFRKYDVKSIEKELIDIEDKYSKNITDGYSEPIFVSNFLDLLNEIRVSIEDITDFDIKNELEGYIYFLNNRFSKSSKMLTKTDMTCLNIIFAYIDNNVELQELKGGKVKNVSTEKSKRKARFITTVLFTFIFFYIANQIVGFGLSETPETYFSKVDFLLNNPYQLFGLIVLHPLIYFNLIAILSGVLVASMYIYIWYYRNAGKRDYVTKGIEHGAARWESVQSLNNTEKDIKSETNGIKVTNNFILTNNVKPSINRDISGADNNNILVIGGSGSGKTWTFVTPNVLESDYNQIVVDPKGGVLKATGKYMEERGWKIKILNFVQTEADKEEDRYNSDGYNFFEYISSIEDITKIVSALASYKEDSSSKGTDEYWEEKGKDIIKCVFAYLKFVNTDRSKQNPTEALNLIRSIDPATKQGEFPDRMRQLEEDMKKNIQKTSKEFEYQQYTFGLWQEFSKESEKPLSSMLSVAKGKLSKFSSPALRNLTAKDELKLEDFGGKEKCILYIITPDNDKSLGFLVSILFYQLISKMYEMARRYDNGELPIPLQIVLDEFTNIGKLPDYLGIISTVRSRNVGITMIVQSFVQIKDVYGENGLEAIMANVNYILFLGAGSSRGEDKSTLTGKISDMVGKTTIEYSTNNKTRGKESSVSESHSVSGRPLMTAEEVAVYKGAILFINGKFPIKDDKYKTIKHQNINHLAGVKGKKTLNRIYNRTPIEQREKLMYEIRKKIKDEGFDVKYLPIQKDVSSIMTRDEILSIPKVRIYDGNYRELTNSILSKDTESEISAREELELSRIVEKEKDDDFNIDDFFNVDNDNNKDEVDKDIRKDDVIISVDTDSESLDIESEDKSDISENQESDFIDDFDVFE